MKRVISLILAFMIVMNSFCFAMPSINKSETVYVNLGEEGNVSEINIYSILTNNTAENYEDYTKYTKVENLTNRKNIESGEEKTIFNVSGERRVAYTGKVGEEYYDKLPWTFKITYKLNGVECAQKDLLGAKGLVEIVLEINANENAKEYYKNNYMLEVTGSYDMDDYLSLESDEAIIANTGNTKTLMFIVLPGQSTTLHIKLGTENFSMDGITMAMVQITGNILDELSDLVDEKENIENAKDAINSSTDVILNSLKGMNNGLNGINNGVTEIKKGTKEIHGLSGLRDEDIAKLKAVLEELEPIIENTNKDLDSMKTNYEIFVEMSEKLSEKTKVLEEDVDNLNDSLSDLEDVVDDLPQEVKIIKNTVKTVTDLTGDLVGLLGSLDTSDETEELEDCLYNIGVGAKTIEGTVEKVSPSISGDAQMEAIFGKISTSAEDIYDNLGEVQKILKEMSGSSASGTKTLAKDLKTLESDLNKIYKMIDKDDAEVIEDVTLGLVSTTSTLGEMLKTANEYSDKLLANSGDFEASIENMKKLVQELKEMDSLSVSMIGNLQKTLKIISSTIYEGTDKTADAILSVNKQLMQITKQADTLINSKNTIQNITDDKWDEIEEKTNIFNIDKDAKVESFGSEKNENVTEVQFILKTPDIKEIKPKTGDLEQKENNQTFWDRLMVVLDKMFGWIGRLFA